MPSPNAGCGRKARERSANAKREHERKRRMRAQGANAGINTGRKCQQGAGKEHGAETQRGNEVATWDAGAAETKRPNAPTKDGRARKKASRTLGSTPPNAKERVVGALELVAEWGGTKRDVAFLIVSAVALVLSLAFPGAFPIDPAWIAIALCGLPIILEAAIGLVTAFDIKADVLVSLALIASVAIGEYFAAGEVAVIMQLGGLLEELTVARARAGIERLVDLTPTTARVVQNGSERIVDAAEVREGALVRVLPGETVPVDGVIVDGQTSIDESRHDRRADSRGQSSRRRSEKRHGEPVRRLHDARHERRRRLEPGTHDSTRAERGRWQSEDRAAGRQVGNVDCGHRTRVGSGHVAGDRGNHSSGHHPCRVLPLRARARYPLPPSWPPSATSPNSACWCAKAMRWSGLPRSSA